MPPSQQTIAPSSRPMNDSPPEFVLGVLEPPNSFVFSAISRNKAIVFLCALVLAAAGLGVGLKRHPTYTASATIQVGQVNPNSPGFFGYVQSATSLATAFSRAISAEPVLTTVEKTLHLSPEGANARLSAEPLPQTPAFRVIATGQSVSAAIKLANVAANAVIAYESESNSANPESASLLVDYRRAAILLQQAKDRLLLVSNKGKAPPSTAIAHAQANVNAATVRLNAIGVAYTAAVGSTAPRSGLVSLLAGATSASSDRSSKAELFGFLGLLAGLVAGSAIAALRERRRT